MCCDLNSSSKPENRSANGNITSSFDMALSLLQDAQTRGLAAAFAGMRREEVERNMSMSPSVSASTSSNILYPGLQQAAAASALGIISPHLLAANRQAAAAFMASQMPMSSTMAANVASTLFQPHSALFGSWSSSQIAPHVILGNGGGPHSPPVSPHSPLSVNHGQYQKHGLSPPKATNSNNSSTSSCEAPPKKARKISVKKEMVSPPIEISMNVSDLYTTTGPISPPSSGSSPNSTHDIQNNNNSNNNNNKDASRDKSFTCTICSRSFGYKHVLQNHERTHTGEKPFECPECHKRFTRDHHLKTHMRLHTGEKPYHCSHCDRQFVQVANLRRHLRVHTGERPYTCEICEGKFSDSNQLKSHMLVHNSEKPFECETCHAKFRRRHHVLNHKCRVQSPPTPAISPSVSEYPVCDQKSTVSHCDGSEESIDRSSVLEAPLDLSEEATSNTSGGTDGNRNRKPHDIRRVFRLPPQIALVISNLPEQTEPEDLSLRSSRDDFILQSPVSLHHDDIDLDELDDAASLYLRHQRLKTALSCTK